MFVDKLKKLFVVLYSLYRFGHEGVVPYGVALSLVRLLSVVVSVVCCCVERLFHDSSLFRLFMDIGNCRVMAGELIGQRLT